MKTNELISKFTQLEESIKQNQRIGLDLMKQINLLSEPSSRDYKRDRVKSAETSLVKSRYYSECNGNIYQVHFRVDFLQLGKIITLNEYFEADIRIQAEWMEPALTNSVSILIFHNFIEPVISYNLNWCCSITERTRFQSK